MDDFLIRAFAAAIGIALLTGPFGCFIVWRRMAYYGAALSHCALLGIATGLLLGVDVKIGVVVVCVLASLVLLAMRSPRQLSTDTLLGILAHAALAFGLVLIATMGALRVDLLGYLFGDVLAVSAVDLVWIYAGGFSCLALLALMWRSLVSATIHEELARVEGTPTTAVATDFALLLSLVVAAAMQIVGLLLIVSMLIIPAATARRFAATPEQMAVIASVIGCTAAAAGLLASVTWDTPAGASIVAAAAVLFAGSYLLPARAD